MDQNDLVPEEIEDPSPESLEKDLRQRAEKSANVKADLTPEEIAALTPSEIEHLLHELRVHQIELEMQNKELRQTHVALEKSRSRYFDLYDLAPVGYFTINPKGIIEEANLTAAIMLGVTRDELVRRPFTHFIFPADQGIYYFQHRQLFAYGQTTLFEIRLNRADDTQFWVSVKAVDGATHTGIRLIINDITEQKATQKSLQTSYQEREEALVQLQAAQKQLVQHERLAAVGQVTAGIAHDFNNILAIIMLQTQLSQKTNDLPKLQARLKIILQQSEYAAVLIQQILDFGRRAIIQPKPLDLVAFLQEQVALHKLNIPENIRFNLAVPNDTCIVLADHNRFHQMFTNLILNARDAMPHGGQIAISLKAQQVTNNPPLPDMPAGTWINISVRDTGTGIQPNILANIFEPFFTTKNPGKGTGLGLAQVYGIIKQHKGFIDVQSTPGQGTTFTIYVPSQVILPETAPARQASPTENAPKGHGEIVLLVEDNTVLREVLVSILEEMNYKTRTASCGEEALEVLKVSSQEIAVVLSDLIMPDMGGEALFRAIRQRGLMTPMIMLSGQPIEPEFIQALLVAGLAGYLTKPPDLNSLAFLLAQAIQ